MFVRIGFEKIELLKASAAVLLFALGVTAAFADEIPKQALVKKDDIVADKPMESLKNSAVESSSVVIQQVPHSEKKVETTGLLPLEQRKAVMAEGKKQMEATEKAASINKKAQSPARPRKKASRAAAPGKKTEMMEYPVELGSEDPPAVMPQCRVAKGRFDWNFEKAKMSDVIEQISQLTCKNFILASSVKPTQEITILSRHPVNVEQAWAAFQAALESNDVALTKTGQFYKLIRRNEGSKSAIPVISNLAQLPFDESMVTYVHEIQNLPKDAARTLVKGMVSGKNGTVDLVGEGFLIISDGAENIRRVVSVLEKIDQPGASEQIHVVELKYAEPQQIQKKLDELFDISRSRNSAAVRAARVRAGIGSGDEESFSLQKVVADERTNKLFIISSEKAFIRVKEVIALLDTPSANASGQGKIHIYKLKNHDAKKIAATISSLTQGGDRNRLRNQQRDLGVVGGIGGFDDGAAVLFQGDVKITADESTNSLLVVSSSVDYQALVRVVEQIDRKPVQVYVEAVIMEVKLNDAKDIGLGAYGGFKVPIPGLGDGFGLAMNSGGKDLLKGVATGAAQGGAAGQAAGLSGFLSTLGFMGPTQKIGGVDVPTFGAILNLLQTSSAVNILSTPSMMTLDNAETVISVGTRIPVPGGSSSLGVPGVSGGIGVQNAPKYEDAKLTFKLTPHVNDVGDIRMEIDQDVSDIGAAQGANVQNAVEFFTKTAKTSVVARDQQTVVIGGLISQKNSTVENKVPILGDIPIIGWLFKTSNKIQVKSNLMLVLTPYIVRTDEDYQKIFLRKQRERQEFIDMYYGAEAFKYDPYIDYTKKSGPIQQFMQYMGQETSKAENGGPGSNGEIVISPKQGKVLAVPPGYDTSSPAPDMTISLDEGAVEQGSINMPEPAMDSGGDSSIYVGSGE